MMARGSHAGATVDIPTYDFVTAARCEESTHVDAADIILFDGILAFHDPAVRANCFAFLISAERYLKGTNPDTANTRQQFTSKALSPQVNVYSV